MKISVVISAYKAERWVDQCLRNVVHQTHPDLDVIFVYDESGDRTGEIARRYAARHPSLKVVRHEKSGAEVGSNGLSKARNAGLALAEGDYVHFMDVDDMVNLDFYARMADAARQADADMALAGMIDEAHPYRNHTFTERWMFCTPEEKFEGTHVWGWGYVWRYMFRRRFLLEHKLQFDPTLMIEDMSFVLQAVLHAECIVTVPGAVYNYKRRPNSALNHRDRDHVRRRNEAWRAVRHWRDDFMAQHGLAQMRPGVVPEAVFSLFGLPLFSRTSLEIGRRVVWRFLGLPIWTRKAARLK